MHVLSLDLHKLRPNRVVLAIVKCENWSNGSIYGREKDKNLTKEARKHTFQVSAERSLADRFKSILVLLGSCQRDYLGKVS
jgi:hypothetical protein